MSSPKENEPKKPGGPTVVFVGTTGEGKSSFGNFILSQSNKIIEENFVVGHEHDSCTEDVIVRHGFLRGDESRPLTIIGQK